VIRRYEREAPTQEPILDRFQRDGWPFCIDNPLTARGWKNRQERLKMALHNLNRGLVPPLLHFGASGATHVFWSRRLIAGISPMQPARSSD